MWPETILEPVYPPSAGTVEFGAGDLMEAFGQLTVYVAFDSDRSHRRPVVCAVPGYPGDWVCAYTSARRLSAAHGGDDVEYSWLRGADLLRLLPEHTGLWCDRGFPEGRAVLLPTPQWPADTA